MSQIEPEIEYLFSDDEPVDLLLWDGSVKGPGQVKERTMSELGAAVYKVYDISDGRMRHVLQSWLRKLSPLEKLLRETEDLDR